MIVDCDTHFVPPDAFDYFQGTLAEKKPLFKFDEEGRCVDVDFPANAPEVPGTTPMPPPGSGGQFRCLWDMEARMKDYETMGISHQLVLPQFTGWWSYLIDADLATAMARSHNEAVWKLALRYPGRLYGVGLVALQDVSGAIEEMERVWECGFKGVVLDKTYPVREHPCGETLGSRRELWPFFRRAEEMGVPVFLHTVQHGHRLCNLMSFQKEGLDVLAPNEGVMSLVSLFTSGLLDGFPKLKIVFTEAGTGFIKPLVQRLDSIFDRSPVNYDDENSTPRSRRKVPGRAKQVVSREVASEKNRQRASHYFKNNFYFTIETEEPDFAEAVEFLGAERFLFATDYPHDDPGGMMKYRDVELLKMNKKISESEKELIRCENARQLFALEKSTI